MPREDLEKLYHLLFRWQTEEDATSGAQVAALKGKVLRKLRNLKAWETRQERSDNYV